MATGTHSGRERPSRGRRAARQSGDDRERAILETFERLLGDRALHEISIDEIARGAGISRPTFYFYFASKEAVLLSLFERMIAQAYRGRDAAVDLLADDPAAAWRAGIAAFFEAFRSHRAVTLAGADAYATSAEVRQVWSTIMETWAEETREAIEAERARGAAPPGPDARELAISLLWMNERVLHTTFAGHEPSVPEGHALDVLLSIWLSAIYGTTDPPRR